MMPAFAPITSLDFGGSVSAPVPTQPLFPHELTRRLTESLVSMPRRLAENFGGMSPWGWPMYWQAYQNSTFPGAGGFPYRGASGTTNDRAYGRDIPFFWSEVDLRGYRVTSRYLAETNPFAIGFMNLLVGYHIRKGYGWQACLKGKKKTPYAGTSTDADPLVEKAQGILDQFRRANKWIVLSREAFYRWRVDGEVFLRIGQSREDGIWCRLVEPEQIGAEDGSTTDPWSYGIGSRVYEDGCVDPTTAVEYHVWDLDSGMTLGEYVDAAYMVHAKANVVANVKRGRPDFFPVLDLFDGTRNLYTNMLLTSVRQAAYAWQEKFPTASLAQAGGIVPEWARGDGTTTPVMQSCASWGNGGGWWNQGARPQESPGIILRTEGSRELNPMPADGRSAGFELVVKLAMRAARMRWNLPGSASGDAEDTTFAAAIQAGGPFPVAVEGSQTEWGECFEEPTALRVLDRAVEAGLLTRDERARLDVEVTEPAVVTPEPDKDTQRRQTLNAAKVLSVTTWQQQEGLDPQHEAQNFEAEAKAGQEQQQQQPATPPDGGGDQSGDASDLFGESVEWVSESAYPLLSEAGREGLVQKKITVKGKGGKEYQRTVWVRGDEPGAAKPDQKQIANAVLSQLGGDHTKLTPANVKKMHEALNSLTVVQIQAIKKAHDVKGGRTKAEHIARLLDRAKELKKNAGPVKKATAKQPQKPDPEAAKKQAQAAYKKATTDTTTPPTVESLKKLTQLADQAGVGWEDMASHVAKQITKHSVERAKPTQIHGMDKPEKHRQLDFNGLKISFAPTPEATLAVARSITSISKADVPDALWKATKGIAFTTQANKDDAYWQKEYKNPNHISAATGGDGKTCVYNGGGCSSNIFAHEGGHNLATMVWGKTSPDPNSEYGKAQKDEPPVAGYGENSPAEDFAEACAAYSNQRPAGDSQDRAYNREQLRKNFPKKFAAIEKIMHDYQRGAKPPDGLDLDMTGY